MIAAQNLSIPPEKTRRTIALPSFCVQRQSLGVGPLWVLPEFAQQSSHFSGSVVTVQSGASDSYTVQKFGLTFEAQPIARGPDADGPLPTPFLPLRSGGERPDCGLREIARLLNDALAIAAKPAPTQRNYDCTKPGNANKSVCKTAARPAPAPKAAVAASRNYDCTKPGNANKTACKTSAAPAPATHAAKAHAPSAAVSATGPQGATAKCRDNTYSHAANHKGACSHHGGVATYY